MTTVRVRHQGRLLNLRGIEVETIEQSTTVSAVPGSQLRMALVRGQIIPVLELGDDNGCLLVGRVRGDVLGIVGLHIVGLEPEDFAAEASSPTGYFDLTTGSESPPDLELASRTEADLELDVEALVETVRRGQRATAQLAEESQ